MSDYSHAFLVQIEDPDSQRSDCHGGHRPRFCQKVGKTGAQTDANQNWFQTLADPEKEGRCRSANNKGEWVHKMQASSQIARQLDQRVTACINAHQCADLTGRDQQPRGGDETRDHRMRQEIRQKPQTEQAHDSQDQTRNKGQRYGRHRIEA